jgi:hypothetical protein
MRTLSSQDERLGQSSAQAVVSPRNHSGVRCNKRTGYLDTFLVILFEIMVFLSSYSEGLHFLI